MHITVFLRSFAQQELTNYKIKMKQVIITFLMLIATTLNMSAQSDRNVFFKCATGKMTYTEPASKPETKGNNTVKVIGAIVEGLAGQATDRENHPEFADAVRQTIAASVNETRRITVIDGGFTDEELKSGMPALVLDGTISSITTTRRFRTEEDRKGKKYNETEFLAGVIATINLKDVYSGEIVKTININSSTYTASWFATTEKALGYVLDKMRAQIRRDLDMSFPLYANVIEGASVKKDKQKEVYIDLGSAARVEVGLYFGVYSVKMIAGKEATKEIARLRVTEVMGEDITLCKVTHGGKELKTALESGQEIRVVSQNVSAWFGN